MRKKEVRLENNDLVKALLMLTDLKYRKEK